MLNADFSRMCGREHAWLLNAVLSSHEPCYAIRARNLYGVEHVQLRPGGDQFPLLGLETEQVSFLGERCFEGTSPSSRYIFL